MRREEVPGARRTVHVINPHAPDAEQEARRAARGFPWCDTCQAPAEGGPQRHTGQTVFDSVAVARDRDHEPTLRQWWASGSDFGGPNHDATGPIPPAGTTT